MVEKNMKIKVFKDGNSYRADCEDLPGTPPNGFGNTEVEAVCHLFYRIVAETTGGPTNQNWTRHLKLNNELIINDKKWNWPINLYSER